MTKKLHQHIVAASLALLLTAPFGLHAQARMATPPPGATPPNVDLYFGDWHNAAPRTVLGVMQERNIFTRGDAAHPTQKGAVLRYLQAYVYATVPAGKSTTPFTLKGAQEIYFVADGNGTITANGKTVDLHRNIAVLVPANLEFTLKAGSAPLNMYMAREPIPDGFRPNADLLVRDANTLPITSSDGLWDHIVKTLFTTADGLGTMESVLTVAIDPLTMGKPHVHKVPNDPVEEIWQSLTGTSLAFVGNHLIRQTPGMAFLHIPDPETPHTNINYSEDQQATFLYIARYGDHEVRK